MIKLKKNNKQFEFIILKSSNILYEKDQKYLRKCKLNLQFINKIIILNNVEFIKYFLYQFILDYNKLKYIKINIQKRHFAIKKFKNKFICSNCIDILPLSLQLTKKKPCNQFQKVLIICKKCKKQTNSTIRYLI